MANILSDDDIYPDSDTELSIYRGVQLVGVVRAVIHWSSNLGYHIRLHDSVMVAVDFNEEGIFQIHLPQGE